MARGSICFLWGEKKIMNNLFTQLLLPWWTLKSANKCGFETASIILQPSVFFLLVCAVGVATVYHPFPSKPVVLNYLTPSTTEKNNWLPKPPLNDFCYCAVV